MSVENKDKIVIGGDFNTNLFLNKNFSKIETEIFDKIKSKIVINANTDYTFAKGGDFTRQDGKSLIDFFLSRNVEIKTQAKITELEGIEHKIIGARFEVEN